MCAYVYVWTRIKQIKMLYEFSTFKYGQEEKSKIIFLSGHYQKNLESSRPHLFLHISIPRDLIITARCILHCSFQIVRLLKDVLDAQVGKLE